MQRKAYFSYFLKTWLKEHVCLAMHKTYHVVYFLAVYFDTLFLMEGMCLATIVKLAVKVYFYLPTFDIGFTLSKKYSRECEYDIVFARQTIFQSSL